MRDNHKNDLSNIRKPQKSDLLLTNAKHSVIILCIKFVAFKHAVYYYYIKER